MFWLIPHPLYQRAFLLLVIGIVGTINFGNNNTALFIVKKKTSQVRRCYSENLNVALNGPNIEESNFFLLGHQDVRSIICVILKLILSLSLL